MSLADAGIPTVPEFLPGIRWLGRSPRRWALELKRSPCPVDEGKPLARAVLEVLVHLSGTLPDKYLLDTADIPEDVAIERIADKDLPEGWSALSPREQVATRLLGDAWVARH